MRIATPLGAAIAGLLTLTSALAGAVPELGDGRVTDLTGTLDDDEVDDVESALADLQQDEGVDLFVLITEDSGGDTESFTDEVFSHEGLGGDDALLAVFLEERALQLQLSDDLDSEISSDEQDEAIDAATEEFAAGDFAAGIIAAGESLGDSLSGESGDGGGGGGISFGTIALILIVGAVVVLGGMWLLGLWQGDRSKKRAAEEKDRQTGELAKRVNTALIETDEALREADQELGFAEAQFNEAEVEPFRLALAEAREELNSAFTLRQKLDDETPEDAETRRQMLQQILGHCEKAIAGINQQKERLRQLRELEKNAPEILNTLPAKLDELQARAGAVHETLGRLADYNPRSWASIKGNGTEAEKRIAFARDQVDKGQGAIEAGDRRAAASAASQAQTAAAEADKLLDAIDHMEKSLGEAQVELPKEIAAAEQDIATLSSYLATYEGDERPRLLREAAEAERLLASARREAEEPTPDYLEAIRSARQANTTADAVLAGAREAEEKRARLASAYSSTMRDAQAAYTRAEDYVSGRRRGIRNRPRTRLAEARRHLDSARRAGPSDEGVAAAERAEKLANEAYEEAREDFDDYDNRGGINIGGYPIPILIGGGGWGGTRWGGAGGGRSMGRSWGGGRSMGGGWGGGGGRSRGGRW
jgi:uncharacterized membrane protein YgcG